MIIQIKEEKVTCYNTGVKFMVLCDVMEYF